MAEDQVQTNPYHAALVASQEAYLGEVLGKYLDVDAKLRLASSQIKQLQDKLALFDQQAEQLREAQEALNAMQTNKDAFEEQNEELKGTATTLMDEVNAIKAELEETRKERQAAQEKLLKVSEDSEQRIAAIEQRHSSEVERLKTERQHAMEREMKAKEQLSKAKKPAARRSRSQKSNEAVDGESSTAKKK